MKRRIISEAKYIWQQEDLTSAVYIFVGGLPFCLGLLVATGYCLFRPHASESLLTYQMVAAALTPAVPTAVSTLFERWQLGVLLTGVYSLQIAALIIWGPEFARFLLHVRHLIFG